MAGWMAGWLAGWLTRWMAVWKAVWKAGWMVDWMEPEPMKPYPYLRWPKARRFCIEAYAGSGGLSYGLARVGLLVLRPLEAFPKPRVYVAMCDLDLDSVFFSIAAQITSFALCFMHFGSNFGGVRKVA